MSLKPDSKGSKGAMSVELAGARIFVDVTIPRTSVRGRLRLLTRGEMKSVRLECRKATAHLGLQSPQLDITREWNEEVATRILAIAVRHPDDETKPLASLADWEECEDDQIGALYQAYQDHADQLDPLAAEASLSDVEVLEIRDAAKKKQGLLLMSYGSQKLAAYAITTAALPSS